MVPFGLAIVTILIYVVISIWMTFLKLIGVNHPTSRESSTKTGPKLLLMTLKSPLNSAMKKRLRWGVVRTCITLILMTALPSLMGLISIFDCTPVETDEGQVWLLDSRRDKRCFSDDTYWQFAGLHIAACVAWLLLIVLYVTKSRDTENQYETLSRSYKVIVTHYYYSCSSMVVRM